MFVCLVYLLSFLNRKLVLAVITDYLYEALALGCTETEDQSEGPFMSCLAYGGPCLECSYKNAFISAAFYISFFWIGQFVLLTIFLAILFQSCSMEEILSENGREDVILSVTEARAIIAQYRIQNIESISLESVIEMLEDLKEATEKKKRRGEKVLTRDILTQSNLVDFLFKIDKNKLRKWVYITGIGKVVVYVGLPCAFYLRYVCNKLQCCKYLNFRARHFFQKSLLQPAHSDSHHRFTKAIRLLWNKHVIICWQALSKIQQFSLWIFIYIAKSTWLETMVVMASLAGTLLQALEPAAEGLPSVISPPIFDIGFLVCSCIFAFDFCAKTIVSGLFHRRFEQQPAYLQNIWHVLDAILLFLTIFAYIWGLLGNNIHRIQEAICIFRTLSLLRPMRKIRGIKTILDSLISAAKPIFFALLFLLMVMTIFGVVGIALFSDHLKFCNNDSLEGSDGQGLVECCGTFLDDDQVLIPQVWANPPSDFDTISNSLLSLSKSFKIGWTDVWFTTSDISGNGIQPVENANIVVASIFYISYMVCVSFFSVTLFANFICDGTLSASDGKDFEFTEIQKFINSAWPGKFVEPPPGSFQKSLRSILQSTAFKAVSIGCIVLNLIGMSLVHRGQDDEWTFWLDLQNDIFFAVYAVEIFGCIIAWGPTLFFRSPLNILDFGIVFLVYIVEIATPQSRRALQILRLIRLYRVFQLAMSQSITMHAVFETLEGSIAQAINICAVLSLFLTVFGTIAVQLFGTTKFGERLGTTANFYNISIAILTLIQILFGDQVEKLVDDCGIKPPFCTNEYIDPLTGLSVGYGDCGSDYAVLFFVSFTVICDFTCMNLFVGYVSAQYSGVHLTKSF